MALYGYRCSHCGYEADSLIRDDELFCISCHVSLKRDYRFNVQPGFQEHFNTSTGRYVSNRSEFNDQLRRASDAHTEYTGIEHNFKPVDPYDHAAFGLSDDDVADGRETFNRAITDGKVTPQELTNVT